jgi:predicted RNA binding protein YcfA (HicA-like mRNA interferase family)
MGKQVNWPSKSAGVVLRALMQLGWVEKPRTSKCGSHKQLVHPDYPYEFTWAFHDGVEIGQVMVAKIAKQTGLSPEDL